MDIPNILGIYYAAMLTISLVKLARASLKLRRIKRKCCVSSTTKDTRPA